MNIVLLFRPPLAWLLVAETLLVGAIGALAWHSWQGRHAPAAVAAAPGPAATAGAPALDRDRQAGPEPTPSTGAADPSPRAGLPPGLRTDPEFLSGQLAELNRVESTFEKLEWRATSAIVDAIQHYVERVVLPSIERTEHAEQWSR